MGSIKIGSFNLNWGTGKDRYINTPFGRSFQGYFGYNKQAEWVLVDGKEVELFNTTPELYKVIMTKALMYSNGIFRHYKKSGDKTEEIFDTPQLQLLEKPNPLQSRSDWMAHELINYSIMGNSMIYGLKAFDSDQVPSVLWNLPPQYMKVHSTGKLFKQSKIEGIIDNYELCHGGVSENFSPNEILHHKNYNAENPLIGMSPFEALKMPISNIREAYGYRNVIMSERGALGIISNEKKGQHGGISLTPQEKKEIEEAYGRNYGTRDKQRKIAITNAAVKYTPTSFPTKDMLLFEEISENTRAIIDAYSLNEYLFGNIQGTTFANLSDGKKIAYQDGIIPYANSRAEDLTAFLGLDGKNEWLEIDYSHIEALQQNEKDKAEIMKLTSEAINKLIDSGFTTEQIENILDLSLSI